MSTDEDIEEMENKRLSFPNIRNETEILILLEESFPLQRKYMNEKLSKDMCPPLMPTSTTSTFSFKKVSCVTVRDAINSLKNSNARDAGWLTYQKF